jgi:hypothetical protein
VVRTNATGTDAGAAFVLYAEQSGAAAEEPAPQQPKRRVAGG